MNDSAAYSAVTYSAVDRWRLCGSDGGGGGGKKTTTY